MAFKPASSQNTKPFFLGADLVVVALVFVLGIGFVDFLSTGNSPFVEQAVIDTSLSSLPVYALLSLTRSLLALAMSYVFAIVYGTLAASSKKRERFFIPLLDILQSLPVIAFLPGFVIALISVFHSSRWGIEIACLLTIFTGQVWNLAFAYYESKRTLQPELVEVATIYQFSKVQKFFFVNLPNGFRPLIYNGMMSMAGGWFFLTTCEAFTLGDKDFRLPGLGSYISVTFAAGNTFNFVCALLTLCVIIVGTDVLLWKPLIAWVNQRREGDDGKQVIEESWFLNVLRHTSVPDFLSKTGKIFLQRLFPKANLLGTGALRKLLIRALDNFSQAVRPKRWFPQVQINRYKKSIFAPWIFMILGGGLVFYMLPQIPKFSQALDKLSSQDWLTLTHAVLLTALKVFLVLIASTLWTVPVGLWLGLNSRLERVFQPIIQNLAAFPAPVLFPLLALVLNRFALPSFFTSVFLMCLGSQWYILFNVIGGASRIPSDLKLVTQVYRFSLWRRFYQLYFPAVLPSLATGWITAAGGAWNASIVAEIVSFPGGSLYSEGIGAELTKASANGDYQRLIASILCIVVALIVLNRTVWRSLHLYAERVKD